MGPTSSPAARRAALRAAFRFGLVAGAAVVGLTGCAAAQTLPPAPNADSAPPADVLFVIPRGTASAQLRGEGGVAIPPYIELTAGAAVVVRNEDGAMHYFFTLPVAPGQTVRREFPTAGRYTYTSILSCSVAGSETVTVQVNPPLRPAPR